jgi:hypothetical protein
MISALYSFLYFNSMLVWLKMFEQVNFQIIFQFLQTLGILVGVFYYITTIRANQRNQQLQLETRETQLFMQIYQQLNSVDSMATWAEVMNLEVESFEDFLERYDSSVNPGSFGKRGHLWWSYNAIGAMVANERIDIRLVAMLLGPMIIAQWEKWEGIIRGTRDREESPGQWAGFEFLYKEMVRVRDQEGWTNLFFN